MFNLIPFYRHLFAPVVLYCVLQECQKALYLGKVESKSSTIYDKNAENCLLLTEALNEFLYTETTACDKPSTKFTANLWNSNTAVPFLLRIH